MIEKLGQLTSLFSALIIFISSIGITLYYGYFDVLIFDYINLSEVFKYFIFNFATFILLYLLLNLSFITSHNEVVWFFPKYASYKWRGAIVRLFGIILKLTLLFVPAWIIFSSFRVNIIAMFFMNVLHTILIISENKFIDALFEKVKLFLGLELYHNFLFKGLIYFIFFIVINSTLNAMLLSTEMFAKNPIIISNENDTITSNRIFLIGKTDDYCFLHNDSSKETTVIKMENIKQITYSKSKIFR